jgi:hypothetical protein
MPNEIIKMFTAGPQRDPNALAEALYQQRFIQAGVPNIGSGGGSKMPSAGDFKDLAKSFAADDAASKDPMNLATAADVDDRAEGIATGSGYSPLKVGQNIGNMSMFDKLMDRYGGLFSGAGGTRASQN